MNKKLIRKVAESNLGTLSRNTYPGSGILIGMSEDGASLFQIYWLMGCRPGSRNCVFVDGVNGILRTELADSSEGPEDTRLTIYQAMAEKNGFFAVSNGHQTTDILKGFLNGGSHVAGLGKWSYEPDKPNFTPRISAVFFLAGKTLEISILKKSQFGDGCNMQLFTYTDFLPGVGYCITTYEGDGSPLPPFKGEPYLLPLEGTFVEAAMKIWFHLDNDNKVALAVKSIDLESGQSNIKIINRF